MDSNTSIASAEKPAAPVTLTSSPPALPLTRSRTSSTGSSSVSDSPSLVMSAVSRAAVPSGEVGICAARGGTVLKGVVALRFSPLSSARSARIRCLSAAVRPPSRR